MPPLSPLALLGLAGSFLEAGRLGGAALVLLGYHYFLRTVDALAVAMGHVTWSRAGLSAVLVLPLTNSGQRFGAPRAFPFMTRWLARPFLR